MLQLKVNLTVSWFGARSDPDYDGDLGNAESGDEAYVEGEPHGAVAAEVEQPSEHSGSVELGTEHWSAEEERNLAALVGAKGDAGGAPQPPSILSILCKPSDVHLGRCRI